MFGQEAVQVCNLGHLKNCTGANCAGTNLKITCNIDEYTY